MLLLASGHYKIGAFEKPELNVGSPQVFPETEIKSIGVEVVAFCYSLLFSIENQYDTLLICIFIFHSGHYIIRQESNLLSLKPTIKRIYIKKWDGIHNSE